MANRRGKKLAPIGKIIKKRMIELDMTKKELSTLIGAHYTYINFILNGERSGAKYMDRIAEVLKLDREKLKNCA
jgi:plasmid maintenance system antidote protein VapI